METTERACANNRGLSRRSLLKAAPALALLGAVPAAAMTDTPIMALLRRHRELTEAAARCPSDDDELLERLFYRERDQVEAEMMAIPAVTAQDMAAKMIVAHVFGEASCLDYDSTPAWIEARALVGA